MSTIPHPKTATVAAHTKGPWTAVERGGYSDFDGHCRVILAGRVPLRIAVVHHDGSPEAEANTSLIVASPKLLAALAEVIEVFQEEIGALDATARMGRTFDKAKAAIRLAKKGAK